MRRWYLPEAIAVIATTAWLAYWGWVYRFHDIQRLWALVLGGGVLAIVTVVFIVRAWRRRSRPLTRAEARANYPR